MSGIPFTLDLALKFGLSPDQYFVKMATLLSRWTHGLNAHVALVCLVAGALLPCLFYERRLATKLKETDSVFSGLSLSINRLLIVIGVLSLLFGVLFPFYEQSLVGYLFPEPRWIEIYRKVVVIDYSAWFSVPIFLGAFIAHLSFSRVLVLRFDAIKDRFFWKRTKVKRDQPTDIRTVGQLLPKYIRYQPEKYIDLDKGLFVGLNQKKKPVYIPLGTWRSTHTHIIGSTGSGKGIASSLMMAQALMAGESVLVIDPKDDEWAPHVLKSICDRSKIPFHLVDLRQDDYQIDLLAGVTSVYDFETLCTAAFSLSEKGAESDIYRVRERKVVRDLGALLGEYRTIWELSRSPEAKALMDPKSGLFNHLDEIAIINGLNAQNGLDMREVINGGGCLYVIGDSSSDRLKKAQRILLARAIQIIKSRKSVISDPRYVTVFLDEFQHSISKIALDGLSGLRDKKAHFILAHQALEDFKLCPADLDPSAVGGGVKTNCAVKLFYRADSETAEYISDLSGEITVDKEIRHTGSGVLGTERIEQRRTIVQETRGLIDKNMVSQCPEGMGYLFTPGNVAQPVSICHFTVSKQELELVSYGQQNPQAVVAESAASKIDI